MKKQLISNIIKIIDNPPLKQKVKCSWCGGRGSVRNSKETNYGAIADGMRTCHKCHGKGTVRYRNDDKLVNKIYDVFKEFAAQQKPIKRLIKDVENALNVKLTDSSKKDLERDFNITLCGLGENQCRRCKAKNKDLVNGLCYGCACLQA